MVTHLFNAMSGVHHREYGLATTALIDDRLSVGLIADLVHINADAIRLAFRTKTRSHVILVTDAVAWRSGTAGIIGIHMIEGAPRLRDGTLAGSVLRMDQAVRNVVTRCGVPLECALEAASTNPARVMQRRDLGSIGPGLRADLVAMNDDLSVTGVWLAGERVR
jgi:N-acetylglucosamine-6-phosphate deacetylase